jgi:integrase/recombinase XerD
MNSNVSISLETRRQKNDGTYPLVLRLGHNASTTTILLGINLKEKDWDKENKKIRKSYEGTSTVSRLNQFIQKRKSEAMDIILGLHENGKLQSLTLAELRKKIKSNNIESCFFSFADELIADLKASHRNGTAKSYQDVADMLRKFRGNAKLPFSIITYSFLTKLEGYHLAKGNGLNGLSTYMRSIRAIYNKAIKAGIIAKETYPFEAYKIRTVPTEKRALDWEYLKKIIDASVGPDHPLFHTRNYFLASYMMYGMNFTDMAFLRKEDITNGRIQYRRRKTSKLYDIKITPALETILSFYTVSESRYVFPILKRESPELNFKDIMWARKRYNKKLKALATQCGIESTLTSYVSRHSFATQAMMLDIPLNAISSMLGHSSLKTTQIYLKSLPANILDDYNAKMMEQLDK